MIKKEELTYGCLVSYQGVPCWVFIIGEYGVGIRDKSGNNTVVSEDKIEPIPITSKILEKIGFKDLWQTNGTVLQTDRTFINYDINNGYLFVMDGDEDLMDVRNIRYVHELQNILRLCSIDKEINHGL